MGSIAGNKRRHNEHTLDVKYAAFMEIDWGFPTNMSRKNSMSQKTPHPRGKRTGKK